MAHLTLLQAMEAGHIIATQRDQAITERDHAQEQAEEWERAARGSAEAAVGWQSKAQTLRERAMSVADKLNEATIPEVEEGLLHDLADILRGESLPSDGEVVRTEETVPTGGRT